MAKTTSLYLTGSTLQLLERAKALGLGGSYGASLQRLAAFALFRFDGPSPDTVKSSETIEINVAAMRREAVAARTALTAACAYLDHLEATLVATEAAHAQLRDDVAALFTAVRLNPTAVGLRNPSSPQPPAPPEGKPS